MKKCEKPECGQNAELKLDGETRTVRSISAALTTDKNHPVVVNLVIRTHQPSRFCYYHNKEERGMF